MRERGIVALLNDIQKARLVLVTIGPFKASIHFYSYPNSADIAANRTVL